MVAEFIQNITLVIGVLTSKINLFSGKKTGEKPYAWNIVIKTGKIID